MHTQLYNALTAWRNVAFAQSSISWLRARRLAHICERQEGVYAGKCLRVIKQFGWIELGKDVKLGHHVGIGVKGLAPGNPAILRIGAHTIIGDRSHINCQSSITIGAHCAISWDVEILDSDMHTIVMEDGQKLALTAPVVIEDRVWIGTRALILKGTTIGHDSIVAAGAVVANSIPPYSICAGNPAKVIRQIKGWIH